MEKTLEKEFAEYKEHHIFEITITGLITLEEKGIYNHRLLNDYTDCKIPDKKDKAIYVANDLYDKYMNNDDNKYLDVYEMIWRKLRNRIDDNKSYRIGVRYED